MKINYIKETTTNYHQQTTQSLEWVIEQIRSNQHEQLVREINDAYPNQTLQKQLKLKLPVFKPSLQSRELLSANGIVQFDIDAKDNPTMDIMYLKARIMHIEEVIYAFISSRGGLKVGVKTDFCATKDDEISIKNRYSQAYDLVINYLCDSIEEDISFDDAVGVLDYDCFSSYDPDAYLNLNCSIYSVNEQCIFIPPVVNDAILVDIDEVKNILFTMPRTLGWSDRRKVNLAVLNILGNVGIEILKSHWTTQNTDKLHRDLVSQSKVASYGDIRYLQSLSKKYCISQVTGRARKNLKPYQTNNPYSPLYSVEAATAIKKREVANFFEKKQSVILNITTGAGKTNEVIDYLVEKLNPAEKVLYLVPSHKLGMELEQTIKSKIAKLFRIDTPNVCHMKGRNLACQEKDIYRKLEKIDVSIPFIYCSSQCEFRHKCEYINQFNRIRRSTIVIMTHQEWSNEQSYWFNGNKISTDGRQHLNPVKNNPIIFDYIVVDENIFSLLTYSDNGAHYPSIKKIIASCVLGSGMKDAILEHKNELDRDFEKMNKTKVPDYSNISELLLWIEMTNQIPEESKQILRQLKSFSDLSNDELLLGIFFDGDKITRSTINQAHQRYKDVPTMYLDATANETVLGKLIPSVQFKNIKTKSKDDVRVHQLCNSTVTKSYLDDPQNYQTIVNGLKKLLSQSTGTAGLITYKNIKGMTDFNEKLANDVGVSIYGNFGNLRGSNIFEDVDVLIILGRHYVPDSEIRKIGHVIYNEELRMDKIYDDKPVLMKDGSTFALNSSRFLDHRTETIYQFTSMAETIQAVGRCRPIHGKPKDVYIFSNECLANNVEITDFFEWDDYFGKSREFITEEALNFIKETKVIHVKQSNLAKIIGITIPVFQKNRAAILEELKTKTGMELVECYGRFKNHTTWRSPRKYLISSVIELKQYFDKSDETLLSYTFV